MKTTKAIKAELINDIRHILSGAASRKVTFDNVHGQLVAVCVTAEKTPQHLRHVRIAVDNADVCKVSRYFTYWSGGWKLQGTTFQKLTSH